MNQYIISIAHPHVFFSIHFNFQPSQFVSQDPSYIFPILPSKSVFLAFLSFLSSNIVSFLPVHNRYEPQNLRVLGV